MNAFAAHQQLLAGNIGIDSPQFQQVKQEIDLMKEHVCILTLDNFFPAESEGRTAAHAILKNMRDQDLKDYVLLFRNQAMAAIDMPGGV